MSPLLQSQIVRIHGSNPYHCEDQSPNSTCCDNEDTDCCLFLWEELIAVPYRKDIYHSNDDSIPEAIDKCEVWKILSIGREVHDETHSNTSHEASHSG